MEQKKYLILKNIFNKYLDEIFSLNNNSTRENEDIWNCINKKERKILEKFLNKCDEILYSRSEQAFIYGFLNVEKRDYYRKLDKNMDELNQDEINEYLKNFDKIFNTNTKKNKKDYYAFKTIFQIYIDEIYKPSTSYKKIEIIKKSIKEKLYKSFNENQKDLFEKWIICQSKIYDEIVEQAFIYGYVMSSELQDEVNRFIDSKRSKFC